jgi:23S rRNA (adenine-N6)-dimethyltransferase
MKKAEGDLGDVAKRQAAYDAQCRPRTRGVERWQRKRRRELGQNFLKDKRVARRIVEEARVDKDDLVVELGAGGGMLTRQLARAAREVVAAEYDPYWVSLLKERFSGDGHVRVVYEDALRVKLSRDPFRVVANVPFCITTSILHRLLDDPTAPPETAHLLVQKQVALKHARSTPTTSKTLNWSPWYELSTGLELPANAFNPKPEVEACLMVAAKRDPPLVDPCHRHLFRALVRLAFDGCGNTVGRVLRPILTKVQLRRLVRDNGFSPDVNPSMLTPHQWASVFGFMIRIVPRARWPSASRHARREGRRR